MLASLKQPVFWKGFTEILHNFLSMYERLFHATRFESTHLSIMDFR